MHSLITMIRFVCIATAAILVVIAGVSCMSRPTATVPIGELAESTKDHTNYAITITNASGGKRHGPFLIFAQNVPGRRHVVLVVGDSDTTGVSTFVGICSGVRVTSIPGCPCPPPFVFVESVSSKTD